MNQLNSILIEGTVVKEAKELPDSNGRVTFLIRSDRRFKYEKDGDVTYATETTVADVLADGKLGGFCLRQCLKDKGVRVIGRLMTGGTLFAESVEIKPSRAKVPVDEEEGVY